MNKEQQDKLWNELSEESKCKIQQNYNTLQMGLSTGLLEDEYLAEQIGKIKELEELFGSHNLNPKPQIKTWEDVEVNSSDDELEAFESLFGDICCGPGMGHGSAPICRKLIATYKIAKLIELSYGGMVSEEEWREYKDGLDSYYSIVCRDNGTILIEFVDAESPINRNFLTFHSKELAEDFMSYESNRLLVQQYFLM